MADKVRVNVYISTDLKKKAEEKAEQLCISVSALFNLAMNEYLKQDAVIDLAAMFKQGLLQINPSNDITELGKK